MPSIGEWLLVKGLEGATRIGAALGNEDCKLTISSLDASSAQFKIMKKVHDYAVTKHITHEAAAEEMGVTLPAESFALMREYDPVHWEEYI